MRRLTLITLALVLCLEILLRWAIDIKIYKADGEVGYWIAPIQQGGAALTGSYVFNDQSFGVAKPLDLSGPRDVILLGDSMVFGKSDLSQDELLGPSLQRISGWDVWPLATGSWGLANALRALDRVDVRGAEAFIFVVNSGDFGPPSAWTSEYETPQGEPSSYLIYSLQKFVPALRLPQNAIPVRAGDLEKEWHALNPDTPILVIAYESILSTGRGCDWLPKYMGDPKVCFDPIGRGLEHQMLDGIHLNAEGNLTLARLISTAMAKHNPMQYGTSTSGGAESRSAPSE